MNDNHSDIDEILGTRENPPTVRHDLAAQIVQNAFAQKPPKKMFVWFYDMRRARPVLVLAACFIVGLVFSGAFHVSPTADSSNNSSYADLLLSGDDLFDWDDS